MRIHNLHTAPIRHFYKNRTFPKKADFYGQKINVCATLKGHACPNFPKFGTVLQHRTKFPRPLTQSYFLAFKFRAQGIFYVLIKLPDLQAPWLIRK